MRLEKAFCSEALHLLDAAMVKIEHCAAQLDTEQLWWRLQPDLNSIGNLLLHISGNLEQWATVPLTHGQDERDRDAEFSPTQKLEKEELLAHVRTTVAHAKQAIEGLDELNLMRAVTIQGFDVTILGAIVHTTSHFAGHVHQVIQLTRIQLGEKYQFEWTEDSDRTFLPI